MDALSDADLAGLKEHLNEMVDKIVADEEERRQMKRSDDDEMDTAESGVREQQEEDARSQEDSGVGGSAFFERVACSACRAKSSPFWRRVTRNKIVCNKCFFDKTYLIVFSNAEFAAEVESEDASGSGGGGVSSAGGAKEDEAAGQGKDEPFVTVKITRSQAKKYEKFTSGATKKEQPPVATPPPPPPSAASSEKSSAGSDRHQEDKLATLRTRKSSRVTKDNQPGGGVLVDKIKSEELDDPAPSQPPAKSAKLATSPAALGQQQSKLAKKGNRSSQSDVLKSLDEIELKETCLTMDDKFGSIPPSAVVGTASNVAPNRRTQVFKRETPAPSKSEVLASTICTSEYVFHRGFYMQVGDIVALFDEADDEQVFFAQIRAFMIDQYGQKSAVLTWLVPAEPEAVRSVRTAQDFRVDLFVPGPAEEFPRPLDCMEFVCRLVSGAVPSNHASLVSRAQYETELLRHKFSLSDEAAANTKLLTKLTRDETGATTRVEHQVV